MSSQCVSADGTRPRVLVVDDEDINRMTVSKLLSRSGFDVESVDSGRAALASALKDPPRLVLLDIAMPGMDGFEVCRELKSNPLTAAIPVVFLTGKAAAVDIVRGFRAGGVDYVTKPFRAEELIARVETHVRLHQLQSLLSICSKCKKIRDEQGQWENIEDYIYERTGTDFTHGYCDQCLEQVRRENGWT